MSKEKVVVGRGDLTPEVVGRVARGEVEVELAPEARERVRRARGAVAALVRGNAGRPVYGVNTGFGALAEVAIPADRLGQLQLNLVRSHSSGVGPSYPTEVVRGMLLLRAQVLAMGHSGVRPEVVDLLLAMLNRGVHPVVPSRGSVGASGDLAPLAHLALVLLGEGEAEVGGEVMPAAAAMARAGLTPLAGLEAREGLALINGTQAMTADGCLSLLMAERLCRVADVAAAMTIEAIMGSHRPADPRLCRLRRHPGHAASASNLRALLAGSEINLAHRDCLRVQDAYSLRCAPQVHGASRDAIAHVRSVLTVEVNAVTDNPLLFLDAGADPCIGLTGGGGGHGGGEGSDVPVDIVSGGNFHGQPVAMAMDYLGIAVAELGNISDRRVDQLLNPATSYGLPAFLASNPGLESGFMVAQVAGASLVSENKVLAHPASVDSIPTSSGREDHVSMGATAASKARRIVENTVTVLAVELVAAARGLDLRQPLRPGKGVRAAHRFLRTLIPPHEADRPLRADILAAEAAIRGGLLPAVEAEVGPLA